MSDCVSYRQKFFKDVEAAFPKRYRNIVWINKKTGIKLILPFPVDHENPNCYVVPNEEFGVSRPESVWRYYQDEGIFSYEWGCLSALIEPLFDTWTYSFSY